MDVHRHATGRRRPLTRVVSGALLGVGTILLTGAVLGPVTGRLGLLPVRSGSMAPTMPVGSLVVVTPVEPAAVEVGDILSFHPPGSTVTVTHRVADVDRDGGGTVVTTRGDANPAADPEPVQLLGSAWRVRTVVPYAGTAIGWLASPVVRLSVGLALLTLVLGDSLGWVWRQVPRPAGAVVRLRRRQVRIAAPIRVRVRPAPVAAPLRLRVRLR